MNGFEVRGCFQRRGRQRHRPGLVVFPRLPTEEAAVVVGGIGCDEGRRGSSHDLDRSRTGGRSLGSQVLPLIGAGLVTPSPWALQAQVTPPAPPPNRKATTPASRKAARWRARSRPAATPGDCPDSVPWCCSGPHLGVAERNLPHHDCFPAAAENPPRKRALRRKSSASNHGWPPSPYTYW